MAQVPVFETDMRVPEAPQRSVQPLQASIPDNSAIGAAVAKLGEAANDFSVKLQAAQGETEEASIKSLYLKKISDARDTYANSEDFKNAPGLFAADRQNIERDLLEGVNDPNRRAKLGLYFAVHGIEADRAVKTKALANEADFNVAGLNERSAEYVRKAASASTALERQTVIDTWNQDIDSQVNSGWMTRQEGVRRKITGGQTIEDADVTNLIRINPKQAVEELQNPERFPSIGPVQRANFINQAKAQQDTVATLEIQNIARRDPARAIGMVGRVGAASEADSVFDKGIVPIESGGRANAESAAGALGVAQLMPATARARAKAMGLNDVAALSDDALRDRLLSDTDLNRKIGLAEFRSLVDRYDGRIYAAAAAYNAGSGNAQKPRADAWVAAAEQKFGPNFTAAQFASVIPIEETRNYVLKLAKTLGAPADGPGLSIAGGYHAAAAVGSVVAAQDKERVTAIKAIAQIAREGDDPATLFKAGYGVDTSKYAAWKQKQIDAAGAGDITAGKALREAEFQREMLPFRQQALRTPPAQLEALVQAESARLAGATGVTVDEKNRLDVARETLKAVHEARKDNIIGLAEQAQMVPADQRVTLDPKADPASQAFGGALAARGVQANAAARFYDGRAIALKPEELAAVKQRWSESGPDENFRMLQAFGKNLDGQALTDTIAAVTGNDKSAPIVAGFMRTRPELAREILVGAKLLEQKDVQEKGNLIRPKLSDALGGLVYPSPAMQQSVISAALYLDTARRSARGTLYDENDTSGFDQALTDVAGTMVKRNGSKVPAPAGMPASQFTRTLDNLTNEDLILFGGAHDRSGRPFLANTISDHAVLKPLEVGGARYVVGIPDRTARDGFAPVWTADDPPQPLVIDMSILASKRGTAAMTPYQRGLSQFRGGQTERIQAAREGVEQP